MPYFSLALLPGRGRRIAARTADVAAGPSAGEVVVVGPGPAGRDWLDPAGAAALGGADDLVGYGPYLDRVPPNPRQTRHASDNRVEAERARTRSTSPRRGAASRSCPRGDPGVFAMAAAVLEVGGAARSTSTSRCACCPG